jgi:2-amino-4-hydroxy-6-hydroxymethyldihydropteridine diphosphokinase
MSYHAGVKTIYLGLGSNLGGREENLKRALAALAPEISVTKTSKMYETAPMYVTDQPEFLNMVYEAVTELPPQDVLQKIKTIQKEMGEHEHNRPRIIDIDILFYGDEIIGTPELTVPHPKIAERAFVLAPMADIVPDFVHPILHGTIAELLAKLGDVSGIRKTNITI